MGKNLMEVWLDDDVMHSLLLAFQAWQEVKDLEAPQASVPFPSDLFSDFMRVLLLHHAFVKQHFTKLDNIIEQALAEPEEMLKRAIGTPLPKGKDQ